MSEPKLITRQVRAQDAPQRWMRQYSGTAIEEFIRKGSELRALTAPIDPAEVDRIIGNPYWTTPPACSACQQAVPVVVRVGDDPDYDSETAYLCEPCLKAALALFQSEVQP